MNRKSMLSILMLPAFSLTVFTAQAQWAGNSDDLPLRAAHRSASRSALVDYPTPPPSGPVTLDAEYDSCEGVFVRYPFNWGTFIFSSMVDELQDVAVVYIVTSSQTNKNNCINYLANNGVSLDNVEFIITPTNSVWIRDYGPWFVRQEDSTLGILDMPYAWSPSWTNDDHFPEFLEGYWGMDYYGPSFWHDGGNMMTDGHGAMMMSTYVNESNPGMSNAQICQIYQDYFGQDTIYIFQTITNDLTGHIDLWAKIMNDTTILVARMQPNDPNYQLVESHAARLATIPTVYGTPFHIVRCPMPPASSGYYKSYINSLLINHKAIVPIYNLTWDAEALASYQTALGPDWDVVGIDCNGIAYAGGAIHCTTIGVPHHEWDYLVNVDFTFEPLTYPITIPGGGGLFQYTAGVENLEANLIDFDFWVDLVLPNGSVYGPLWLRENLTLNPNSSLLRQLQQNVPGSAPAGTYSYRGYVGSYLPRVVSAQDSFAFIKLGISEREVVSAEWKLEGGDTEIRAKDNTGLPTESIPVHVFPNPFNHSTTISYRLSDPTSVKLEIYSINGQRISTLAAGWRQAGLQEVTWEAAAVASGIYLCRLQAGPESRSLKILLLK